MREAWFAEVAQQQTYIVLSFPQIRSQVNYVVVGIQRIRSTLQGTFRVSNPIVPKQEEQDGTGLGLINLSKRYQLLCGKNIEISKRDNIFAVEVPLIHPAQAQKLLLSNQNQSPLKPHKS